MPSPEDPAFPPDDATPPTPRWRWLDRWFTPPWRALLTWMVLAVLGAVVLEHSGNDRIRTMVHWSISLINGWLPTPLPAEVTRVALIANSVLLITRFEPLALRLNLPRGAAWLGLRIAQIVVGGWAFRSMRMRFAYGVLLLFGVVRVPVLLGWRSRPWMVVISGVLVVAHLILCHTVHYRNYYHLEPVVESLCYAILLLYGTRLLQPEERGRY